MAVFRDRRPACSGISLCVAITASISARAFDMGVVPTSKDPGKHEQEALFQPYDPIEFGYRKDSNDVPFIDVTLSMKLRLSDRDWHLPWRDSRWLPRPYLGLTTRFGFYLETRQDSPVVQKSFKPVLLLRWWEQTPSASEAAQSQTKTGELERDYVDLAYAHESNGQGVHTPEEYSSQEVALAAQNQGRFVNDYIHRGWDFIEVTKKTSGFPAKRFALLGDAKYFLPDGLLQGPEDEWHPAWEKNGQGKPRKAVDGLAATLLYEVHNCGLLCGQVLSLGYTTGYRTPFKYSTFVASIDNIHVLTLPLSFWLRDGYLSNLSMYYVKVKSIGLGIKLTSW